MQGWPPCGRRSDVGGRTEGMRHGLGRLCRFARSVVRAHYPAHPVSYTHLELEGRVKTVDMLQKNGMINRLEERLKRTEKEVDARDETEIG